MKRVLTDARIAYIRAHWPTDDAEDIAVHLGINAGAVRRCAAKNRFRKHPDVIREIAQRAGRASIEKRPAPWPNSPAMDVLAASFGMRVIDLDTGSKLIHRMLDEPEDLSRETERVAA